MHQSASLVEGVWRAGRFPRSGENFDRKVAHAIRTIAEAKGVTVAQIAIAECFLGDDFRILVGACRPDMLAESLGTLTKNAPSLSGLAMAHNLLR
jgi:aryl-alcohol dehydrogenase-like predicted oxidoreductase